MLALPDRLPLYDGSKLARWIDEHEARELIKTRQAELLRTKKRIRALRLISGATATIARPIERGSGPRPTRYSHNRETIDNPPKVWTLVHLPKSARRIFLEVLISCR
jgi:hypothetical protein